MSIEMEINDGVAVIIMNRPERKNAFTREQYELLAGALKNADTNDEVRVVVLTGAGAAFSSGQDLKEIRRGQWRSNNIKGRRVHRSA
jgi:enoyl-CoA hydratase/carnithine racemase